MTRAIVTVNYGQKLTQNSRESMQAAAERWGDCSFEELNEVTAPKHPRLSPPAMKTMAFMLLKQDELFLLDADVIVSGCCPSPFEAFPNPDDLVAVRDRSTFDCQKIEYDKIAERLPNLHCPMDHETYWNSGMVLARRPAHEAMFALTHALALIPMGLAWCDQTLFVISANICRKYVRLVDEQWNFLAVPRFPDFFEIGKHPEGPYVLHGAGDPSRERWLHEVRWQT